MTQTENDVVLEQALITVRAGTEADFEAALGRAADIVREAKGFVSLALHRCIEQPHVYLLLIEWEHLEDHTVGFRGSEAFTRWRAEIGSYFNGDPVVNHFARALPALGATDDT